jgi:hypothetical protein
MRDYLVVLALLPILRPAINLLKEMKYLFQGNFLQLTDYSHHYGANSADEVSAFGLFSGVFIAGRF